MGLFSKTRAKPPAKPAPKFGLWLRKGREHIVNGQRVLHPDTGVPDERDDVFHELPVGKHIVDGCIAWVHDPSAGFKL